VHTKYSEEGTWQEGVGFVRNPDYIKGINNTRCIQRLGPPLPEKDGVQQMQSDAWLGISTFAGMPDHARKAFSALSTLEYMGSSEFEFGAVPQSLRRIIDTMQQGELVTYERVCMGPLESSFSVRLEEIPWVKDLPEEKRDVILHAFSYACEGKSRLLVDVSVYVIAPRRILPHVDAIIDALALDDRVRLQEPARFRDVLFCPSDFHRYPPETIGWMEIDNDFLFFSDKSIWLKWVQALGLSVPQPTRDLRIGDARSELKKLGFL
jgi:hypothetical protein